MIIVFATLLKANTEASCYWQTFASMVALSEWKRKIVDSLDQ
jgi:hypothetical protein